MCVVGRGEGNNFCVEVGGTQATDSANDRTVMCVCVCVGAGRGVECACMEEL